MIVSNQAIIISQHLITRTPTGLDNMTQNYLPAESPTLSSTEYSEPTFSKDQLKSLTPRMLQLSTNTDNLILALENVIKKVHTGRQKEIVDRIMPLCKFLETLQEEHTQLEMLQAVMEDAWVKGMLEQVEIRLQRIKEGLKNLVFLEETECAEGGENDFGDEEEERGERHYNLALRQFGSFGTDLYYGM